MVYVKFKDKIRWCTMCVCDIILNSIVVHQKLTCDQWRRFPSGKRLKRFTNKTHALQISPCRGSCNWKHSLKSVSYFLESVKRELLDLALQMQQPCDDRYTFGLWNENIVHFSIQNKFTQMKFTIFFFFFFLKKKMILFWSKMHNSSMVNVFFYLLLLKIHDVILFFFKKISFVVKLL